METLSRERILTALQRLDAHLAHSGKRASLYLAALELVLRYYPEDRLPVRTRLLLEELLGGEA